MAHHSLPLSSAALEHAPTAPEEVLWDAIVIGTGMGGATAGYELARGGLRVLFLEKGRFLFGDADRGTGELPLTPAQRPDERLASGWWPHPLDGETSFGGTTFFAPVGCGTGGTSSLYGSQLERFHPADFRPRASHPTAHDANLPEAWPIRFEELLPYYERAEALYRVHGTPDPLAQAPDAAALLPPPPLSERDQAMFDAFVRSGLHPYRAHVGFEYVDGCGECGATLCPRECKSDSGRICLIPALRDHGAKILCECEVVALDADATQVRAVRCRIGERELQLRGRVVILAAGAFMSPALLLASRSEHWPNGLANRSDQVGRNLMVHAHQLVAVSTRAKLSTVGPKKSLSFNDFYADGESKLGTVQSLGITVFPGTIAYYIRGILKGLPAWLTRSLDLFIRVAARIAAIPFRNAAIFAALVEDLPYARNRIVLDPGNPNGMRFEYHYPEELRVRSKLILERLRKALRRGHRVLPVSGRNNLNFGHVCGTVRFGDDPTTSVLDRNNRAHDVENLYVVDASFLPTSGGTNLSLTIAANALRSAEAIRKHLQAEAPRAD